MKRSTLVRWATFLATCFGVWGVLSIGTGSDASQLEVGDPAPRTYEAQITRTVEDTVETERLEQAARDSVQPIWEDNPEAEQAVQDNVSELFADLTTLVVAEAPALPEDPTLPSTTTSTTDPAASSTTTTLPPEPVVLTGVVFLDVDGDGVFNPAGESPRPDRGLERITVILTSSSDEAEVMTGPDGAWSYEGAAGEYIVEADVNDTDIPTGFAAGEIGVAQLVECTSAGEECPTQAIGFQPNLNPIEEVAVEIGEKYALAGGAATTLAATASDDLVRAALALPLRLTTIQSEVTDRILQEFGQGIRDDNLLDVRARARTRPPAVFFDDGPSPEASEAAGEVVATLIQDNEQIDRDETASAENLAAQEVDPVEVVYNAGQPIVEENETLTQLHIDAIDQTNSIPGEVKQEGGLLAVVAVLIGILGLYLATFRPEFWSRPRMVALLGILIVLAAAAVRGTVIIQPETSWYVLPAVAFGFVTAVLFDSRIAVLMALAVGVITAVGTRDIGVTVYAVLATMSPIPFVSSVSSRGSFRNAVVFSSLSAAVAAAATSWFFATGPTDQVWSVVGISAAWAFGVSILASLIGLAALQFFESAFDITTTLSLLDLTDRNHEALQLLQEKAFGTFNHSLMVGTLSHAAARAIDANALLARAMAYYHDLGKTENPTYFIENQFGMTNPHDLITPEESADIIRRHVTDGVALAKEYKIPTDVATGIVSHHGDGVMRFFYEKAKAQSNGDVDPAAFRHVGHKPRTAESAIVMLADSLEAACRAVFQVEEPNPQAIEKVVDRIVNEKVDDGQLSESPLTLSDLTKIREAFLESLVGHYHQRIAYPNFPGT
jgi:cyclic-di-AMP phosphodiesterase PgpH